MSTNKPNSIHLQELTRSRINDPASNDKTKASQSKTSSGADDQGPFLYDMRKEKNRKLTNGLVLGSVTQGRDFFSVFEENKKFYIKPALKELKVFHNDIEVPYGQQSKELNERDIIVVEKAKYIVNSSKSYSMDEARKFIAQLLLKSSASHLSQTMHQSQERLEQLNKELEVALSELKQIENLKNEQNSLRQKIVEYQAKLMELDKMNLDMKIREATERVQQIKQQADEQQQQYAESREKFGKHKDLGLGLTKKSHDNIDEKMRLELEEKALEQKMIELQEKKKKLGAA